VTEEERSRIREDMLVLEIAEACLDFVAEMDYRHHEIPLALRLVRRAIRAREDSLHGLG
jgi:hypothetical protein